MTTRDPYHGVRPEDRAHADAAKRASDIVRTHIIAGAVGRWVALRLSDGGSDGRAYDSKAEAVRFQLHEMQCFYIKVPPDDFSPRAAGVSITLNRQLYDAGMRLADPDKQVDLHSTQGVTPQLITETFGRVNRG